MPLIPLEGAFKDIDVMQIIIDERRNKLMSEYAGISIEEVAAIKNVTLVFAEMETSYSGSGKNKDGQECIVLDPSLRKEDREQLFYQWLVVILAEREGHL